MLISFAVLAMAVDFVAVVPGVVANIDNRLVKMSNQTENGFNQISIQLQRRYAFDPKFAYLKSAMREHA